MARNAEHTEVAAFLSAFAEPSESIETHAARIILAGHHAYKIKKRVKLPFLDFTTLESRKTALDREQTLNSPFAPELYQGVLSITREADGRLALDGKGTVIDYVLIMRRFPPDALVLDIARKAPLERSLAENLAHMAAAYHLAAPIRYRTDGTHPVRLIVDGLIESFRAAAPGTAKAQTEVFERKARAAIERLSPLLDHRALGGAIRRCHGDLHLGNIVLLGDRPVPFDALEFDETLAEIDVLYDLAFLLMDLLRLGDRAAANVVLNAYVQKAPLGSEIDGLATLPLFIAMRAAVRAVVSFMQDAQGHSPQARTDGLAFLEMATSTLRPRVPCLIAIGGFSGSGKTTVARALAPKLPSAAGALHLRTDVERKRLFGVDEFERLSEDHYTQAVSDQVYDITFTLARRALDQGHSVILDAVFAKPEERDAAADIARAHGAGFLGLWLEAPADDLLARVEARHGDASDATRDVVTRQLSQSIGRVTWPRLRTHGKEAESFARVEEVARNAGCLTDPPRSPSPLEEGSLP